MKIYLHLFYPWHEEEQRHVDFVDGGGIIIAEGGPILLPEAALPLVGDVIKFAADKLSDAPSGYYTVEGRQLHIPQSLGQDAEWIVNAYKVLPYMDEKQPKPRTMSLKQVLDAADRASGQVASWPKWKQDLP